jgi:dethiobiotin synthetase/malonyl-CoA O-methyltransferase
MQCFVTGTDTDVGKTVAAGILTHAFKAKYWKPIQAGTEPTTDSKTIASWLGSDCVLPEGAVLKAPMSPNQAAKREKRELRVADFELPQVEGNLVVEGAGGLFVPINQEETMMDLMAHFGLPTFLVARTGLGTLNHTLLSIEVMRKRKLPLHGVIFSGESHPENEADIAHFGQCPIIGRIPPITDFSQETFSAIANNLGL